MNTKQIEILAGCIERDFLPFVRKPSRYIAGEINQVKKDLAKCDLTVALCFPDIYEVGMSHTGLAIIYDVLNKIDNVVAERVFAPWADAEELMRQKKIPLFTLESKARAADFDVIGFSLTNELCYSNALNMLDLAGLEIRSCNRNENDPLIVGGGGMANCCEPMAEFFDLFVLGEAEEAAVELATFLITAKKEGLTKENILKKIARKFEWAYVPSLYSFEYTDSKIKSLQPKSPDLPVKFKSAVVEDFENASTPLAPIVPFAEAIHDRISIEIMRGCPRRCLFCQASFCRRPVRSRSIKKILEIAKVCYYSTGFDTIGLLSLSTADYPNLEGLMSKLHSFFEDKYVGLSLPSLRVDQQLKLIPELAVSVRKGGLTIAVEAASERLRQIVNKPLKDKDLFAAVEAAYRAGWKMLKLYFMVGLPGEKEQDIIQIVHLSDELSKLRKNIDNKIAQINAAVSWFVPKAHTPLGWVSQKPKEYFENAKQLILNEKKKLRAKFLQFKFHNIESSVLESAIGRGGRKLCDIIEAAWRDGAKFDLWREHFNYQIWRRAFDKFGIDLEVQAQRQYERSEILPWEHLGGPDKKDLLKYLDKADEIRKCEHLI